jgi:hypothetical protein
MSYESLGACGTADSYDARAVAELEFGIGFLRAYVGEPPKGCRLEIVEHDHELGTYATIGLCWDVGSLGSDEWDYYRRCEEALLRLNDAVNWSELADILFVDPEEGDNDGDSQSDDEQ